MFSARGRTALTALHRTETSRSSWRSSSCSCSATQPHWWRCISIPPKHSVSYVVGYIKGQSAISIARRFAGKAKNFTRENFWARGYFVTTIGLDEEMVRAPDDGRWIIRGSITRKRTMKKAACAAFFSFFRHQGGRMERATVCQSRSPLNAISRLNRLMNRL